MKPQLLDQREGGRGTRAPGSKQTRLHSSPTGSPGVSHSSHCHVLSLVAPNSVRALLPLNYYNQVQWTSLHLKMSSSEKRNRVLLKRVSLCHGGHPLVDAVAASGGPGLCCSVLPVSHPARKPQPAQLCSCRSPLPSLGFSHHLPPALLSTRARSPESTDSRAGDGGAANWPFIISVTQKRCHHLCSLGLAGGPRLTLTRFLNADLGPPHMGLQAWAERYW